MTRSNRPPVASNEPPVAPDLRRVVPRPGDDALGDDGSGMTDAAPPAAERTSPARRCGPRARRRRSGAAQRAVQRQGRRPAAARGRRRRWSGPGPDDRDPQPLGRLVSRVSLDRGWSPRLTDATVLGRWPHLVGPDVADHCTPVSLRDGELVLQAESTAWATQLRTLQRQLLARLAAAVGPDIVRRIRVVGPSGPSWRHGPRTVRGRGPRDTYG